MCVFTHILPCIHISTQIHTSGCGWSLPVKEIKSPEKGAEMVEQQEGCLLYRQPTWVQYSPSQRMPQDLPRVIPERRARNQTWAPLGVGQTQDKKSGRAVCLWALALAEMNSEVIPATLHGVFGILYWGVLGSGSPEETTTESEGFGGMLPGGREVQSVLFTQ